MSNPDETYRCGPDDVDKEIALLESRVNDHFPQGRQACVLLMMRCKQERREFVISATKTWPYWTWYYTML